MPSESRRVLAPTDAEALSHIACESLNQLSFQALIDSLPYFVLIVDEDRLVHAANAASLEAFGVASERLIGRRCTQAVHGTDAPPEGCPLTRLLEDDAADAVTEFFDEGLGIWLGSSAHLLEQVTPHGKRLFLHTSRDITNRKKAEEEVRKGLERTRAALLASVEVIGRTVEARDPYTAGHQRRVAALAGAIAERMGLQPEEVDGIRLAAELHDLGKVSIPGEILGKPGRLTGPEFELIKAHPEIAHNILKSVEFPWPLATMVLQHHERMDGSGYPSGLHGGEISIGARVIGVSDVVEAIHSHRPYRPALGLDVALNELRSNRGVLYDGEVVEHCIKLFEIDAFDLDATD